MFDFHTPRLSYFRKNSDACSLPQNALFCDTTCEHYRHREERSKDLSRSLRKPISLHETDSGCRWNRVGKAKGTVSQQIRSCVWSVVRRSLCVSVSSFGPIGMCDLSSFSLRVLIPWTESANELLLRGSPVRVVAKNETVVQ